jgi:hypothetical protein
MISQVKFGFRRGNSDQLVQRKFAWIKVELLQKEGKLSDGI